ncbi:MAG: hypothetical protein MH186_07845 [Marinobacter sp.]|nr:hypothetical protein [Marinobacter sp.]
MISTSNRKKARNAGFFTFWGRAVTESAIKPCSWKPAIQRTPQKWYKEATKGRLIKQIKTAPQSGAIKFRKLTQVKIPTPVQMALLAAQISYLHESKLSTQLS